MKLMTPRNLGFLGVLALASVASAGQTVPKGTEVILRFEQPLSSRTAKAGDTVPLVIDHNVMADGHVILAAGTPVRGVIVAVDKNDRFGKNARIRLALDPVHGIPLEPRDKGKMFQSASTDRAAEVAGAGALVLGPLGLAAGYFVTGKSVHVKPGDHLRTEVSQDTHI